MAKENYKEIFRLKEMLEKAGIPFVFKEFNDFRDGFQILYPEGNTKEEQKNVCSVIEHIFSYGNEVDKLEIMGLLTDEESEFDTVKGFLSAENVFERIQNHFNTVKKE